MLLQDVYLLPVMAALLAVALGSLAWRATSRHGYAPLVVGAAASLIVLVAKFAVRSDPFSYLGAAVLLGASIWNSWPHRAAPADPCALCAPQAARSPSSAPRE
jgi:hypothetical protein